MYNNLKQLIATIIKETKPTVNVSLGEIADEVKERIGLRPSRTTIKRLLNELGIQADGKRKRVWVWKHKEGHE